MNQKDWDEEQRRQQEYYDAQDKRDLVQEELWAAGEALLKAEWGPWLGDRTHTCKQAPSPAEEALKRKIRLFQRMERFLCGKRPTERQKAKFLALWVLAKVNKEKR